MSKNLPQLPKFLFFQRPGYCRLLQARSATYHKLAFKIVPNIPEYCDHPAVTQVLNIILECNSHHQASTEYIHRHFVLLLFALTQQPLGEYQALFIFSFKLLPSVTSLKAFSVMLLKLFSFVLIEVQQLHNLTATEDRAATYVIKQNPKLLIHPDDLLKLCDLQH